MILSHMRNRLSSQSVRAILCLGSWSVDAFVGRADLQELASLEEIVGDEDVVLEEDWDGIEVN